MDGQEFNKGRRGSTYIQVRMPNRPERPHLGEEQHYGNGKKAGGYTPADHNPTDWVQNLLDRVRDVGHKSHSIFSELDVLKNYQDSFEWREAARWVKYEENVEEGGKRWSKPHVASLSMSNLFELRTNIADKAVILLDYDCYSFPEVVDKIVDEWINRGELDNKLLAHIRDIALRGHKHRHIKRPKGRRGSMPAVPSLTDIEETNMAYSASSTDLATGASFSSMDINGLPRNGSGDNMGDVSSNYRPNTNMLRKVPKDTEVAIVMVGEVEDLEHRITAFVRLKESRIFPDMCEINMPTRFVFFSFGPKGSESDLIESGRCIGTMMVDEIVREVAYKATCSDDILAGIDEFMEQVTVLPPGEWDPKIRIEPPNKVQSQDFRKSPSMAKIEGGGGGGHEEDAGGHGDDPSLSMSKIPFRGLIDDIKRKAPFYLSDYKDALHIQCLASFVYVFLGTLTPNVTFGGLLGVATDQYMGVMECIAAAAVTGILFALFGGQPLNILGSTGPMLVLEKIIYDMCKDNGWEFMPLRFWVGMWTVLIILIVVIFNLSALVKYITRFTEDSFATLIAVIFIVEAFKKLFEINTHYPVQFNTKNPLPTDCECLPRDCSAWMTTASFMTTDALTTDSMTTIASNTTDAITTMASTSVKYTCAEVANFTSDMWRTMTKEGCEIYGGTLSGAGCHVTTYVPNVFFFSILLFLGTFGIAIALVQFKTSSIFPAVIRQRMSDFAVLIAILAMVLTDYFVGIDTPKLTVPDEFVPTRPGRGWVVNPFAGNLPWWLYIAAVVPAILSTILIFLDQQITAVIVNRKEHKLKKGVGYHLDMFVVAICVAIHSVLGLPWYVAATVSALAHVNSLKKESECTAPGEKPTFLGIREQRVTALFIGILSGLAVLITPVLKMIPMPVLYGVFFYMGFSALRGMQFVDRLFLFIQPKKYQPDLPYVRHVPLWRIHMFTIIQILCLVLLWIVKTIKSISIGFPLLVLATGIVRKLLECVYSQYELKYLDDLLPGATDKKKDDVKIPYKDLFNSDSTLAKSDSMKSDNGVKPRFFVSDEYEKQTNTQL